MVMQWVVILELTVVSGYFARRAEVMDDGAACKPKATNLAGQRDFGTMSCDGKRQRCEAIEGKAAIFYLIFYYYLSVLMSFNIFVRPV